MPSSRSTWLALVVVLAACVPYLPTIDDYFTQDDFGVVQLLASKSWSTFPRWFTMPWMEHIWGYTPDEIRPFVAFTYQVSALPGAGRPELHHVVNIVFHAANALLVMALARLALRVNLAAAAYAGLVFALLPVQAESVAWITGRVDSMPAFFYLAAFMAYVRWRLSGTTADAGTLGRQPGWYALALVLFFVALFSKQNTITMVATLAAYDLFVLDRERRGSLISCLAAWLPFAMMTLGYLALRRALFGASVRGGIGSREQVALVGDMIERHLLRTVLGHAGGVTIWEWLAVAMLVTAVAVMFVRMPRLILPAAALTAGWWAIGAAPVLVAGYESPRHVYLASMAWAMLIAIAFDGLDRHRLPRAAVVTRTIAGAVVAAYAVLLVGVVGEWNRLALVSERATQQLAREARVASPGGLVVVGVPGQSWEWALPFAARPPFATGDLTQRVFIISPRELHCCRQQWFEDTRQALEAWAAGPASGSVAVLRVDERAAAGHLSSLEQPSLPEIARTLSAVRDPNLLDQGIRRLLDSVSVGR